MGSDEACCYNLEQNFVFLLCLLPGLLVMHVGEKLEEVLKISEKK